MKVKILAEESLSEFPQLKPIQSKAIIENHRDSHTLLSVDWPWIDNKNNQKGDLEKP